MKSLRFFGLLKKPKLVIRRVVGSSMEPTLPHGQIIIGWRTGKLEAGDVVIVTHGELEKVKRIQRATGDKVYLLGDNPLESTDSRQFGWLPQNDIIAKVVWPRPISKTATID